MPRQVGAVRAWTEAAALAPLWAALRVLPLASSERVGAMIGPLAMRLDLRNRAIALRNLQIAFPELTREAHRQILRRTYSNFGRMMAEWVHTFDFNHTNIERYVTYAGREHWNQAKRLSDGRGILVLCAHFGNWELQFVAHSIYGTPGAIVQRPNRNPVIDAAVMMRRERFGSRAIPRRGAGRSIMRLLRDNWMVAIPLDLDTRQGIFVDFFSMKAATTDALARLALATRAPVLPFFMVREDDSTRHRATFLSVIETIRSGDREADVLNNTQRYTAVIESMIRQHPDHWNWIHRRWKTRPPGEQRFY